MITFIFFLLAIVSTFIALCAGLSFEFVLLMVLIEGFTAIIYAIEHHGL